MEYNIQQDWEAIDGLDVQDPYIARAFANALLELGFDYHNFEPLETGRDVANWWYNLISNNWILGTTYIPHDDYTGKMPSSFIAQGYTWPPYGRRAPGTPLERWPRKYPLEIYSFSDKGTASHRIKSGDVARFINAGTRTPSEQKHLTNRRFMFDGTNWNEVDRKVALTLVTAPPGPICYGDYWGGWLLNALRDAINFCDWRTVPVAEWMHKGEQNSRSAVSRYDVRWYPPEAGRNTNEPPSDSVFQDLEADAYANFNQGGGLTTTLYKTLGSIFTDPPSAVLTVDVSNEGGGPLYVGGQKIGIGEAFASYGYPAIFDEAPVPPCKLCTFPPVNEIHTDQNNKNFHAYTPWWPVGKAEYKIQIFVFGENIYGNYDDGAENHMVPQTPKPIGEYKREPLDWTIGDKVGDLIVPGEADYPRTWGYQASLFCFGILKRANIITGIESPFFKEPA